MFDFSWSEILLIGVVALVVIGPKDLPRVLKTVGQYAGRARAIARDFQFQIDQMVRDSELDDVRKTMNAAASGDIDNTIRNLVDPGGELEKSVSTSEMLGQTDATPVPPETVETPPAPSESAELPALSAEPPLPFPQPLMTQRQPEPVPVAPEASPEAKSGTHG
jgi:sec-independent protein translocase protein TatB